MNNVQTSNSVKALNGKRTSLERQKQSYSKNKRSVFSIRYHFPMSKGRFYHFLQAINSELNKMFNSSY